MHSSEHLNSYTRHIAHANNIYFKQLIKNIQNNEQHSKHHHTADNDIHADR